MVLIYDDFRNDNKETVRSVLRFLDVDDIASIDVEEVNPTVRVRSRFLNRIIYRGKGPVWQAAKKAVRMLAPGLWQLRWRVIYTDPPPPDEEYMLELRRRFKPEVVALSEYLNRDLVTLWGYDKVD